MMKDDGQSSSLDFEREPFKLNSDLRFLFQSNTFQRSLASLLANFETSESGTAVLTGRPGTGKTLLIKKLAATLEAAQRRVFYFASPPNSLDDMLAECARNHGIAGQKSIEQDAQAFLEFLQQPARAKPAVLIIDEADHILSSSLIGSICALTSRERNNSASLQVLLSAESQFKAWLARQENYADTIAGALTCRVELEPLDRLEVGAFIQHRLDIAMSKHPGLFTEDAIALIAELSGGLPGRIMSLCSQALMLARMESRPYIDKDLIEHGATELGQPLDDHVFEVLHTKVFAEALPERTPAVSEPDEKSLLIDRFSTLDDEAQLVESVDAASESIDDNSRVQGSLSTHDTALTDEPVDAKPESHEHAGSTNALPPTQRPRRRRWRLGAGAVAATAIAAAIISYAHYPPWAADWLNAGWRSAQALSSDSYHAVVAMQTSIRSRLFSEDGAAANASSTAAAPDTLPLSDTGAEPSRAANTTDDRSTNTGDEQWRRLAAQTALDDARARQKALEAQRDRLDTELQQARAQLQSFEQRYRTLDSERSALSAELEASKARFATQQQAMTDASQRAARVVELESRNRTLEDELARLKAELETTKTSATSRAQASEAAQSAKIEALEVTKRTLQSSLGELRDDLEKVQQTLTEREQALEANRADANTAQQELATLRSSLARSASEQRAFADVRKGLEDELARAHDELRTATRALAERDNALQARSAELEEARAARAKLETTLETANAKRDALEQQRSALEQQTANLRSELDSSRERQNQREQTLKAHTEQVNDAQQKLADANAALAQSKAERLSLTETLKALQNEVARLRAEQQRSIALAEQQRAQLAASSEQLLELQTERDRLQANLQAATEKSATQVAVVRAAVSAPPATRKPGGTGTSTASTASSRVAQDETDANRALIARGDRYLALGDIASARLFFELAAKAGSATAATAVAKTYDPLFYEARKVVGTRANPEMALQWYRKAVKAGDRAAESQRRELMAWLRQAASRGDSRARQLLDRN